jgi:hypothetical protein
MYQVCVLSREDGLPGFQAVLDQFSQHGHLQLFDQLRGESGHLRQGHHGELEADFTGDLAQCVEFSATEYERRALTCSTHI